MRSGAWMLDTSMRIAPTKILLDRVLSQAGVLDRVLSYATWATYWSRGALGTRQRSTKDSASLHPCRQAASFLPCARPPDACGSLLARPRSRLDQRSRDRAEAPVFAVTRAGTDTMPTRRDDADETTEGAAFCNRTRRSWTSFWDSCTRSYDFAACASRSSVRQPRGCHLF